MSNECDAVFDYVSTQDYQPQGKPHGWIQWKNTDACIDLRCACGYLGHFDGYFLYHWECPACYAKYSLGNNVALIPLTQEQAEIVNRDHIGFKPGEIDFDDSYETGFWDRNTGDYKFFEDVRVNGPPLCQENQEDTP